MVDGKGRAKIHIDRGAVGGRAARDAGVLPQLQLSKAHQGHAAAAFACLAVFDAAAGDPDGTPGCQDAAAGHGRAAADDAAGHGDGAGLGIDRAAVGAVVGGEDAVPDGAAGHGDGAALGIDAAAIRGIRSALDAAGIDGAARQHEGRARLHIHAAAIVIIDMIAATAAVIPVALAAGDEAACGQGCVAVGRRGGAVGQGQGAAAGDAEDAVGLCALVKAQDVAVQIYRGVACDPQRTGDGHVLRQRIHAVSQAVGQIGVDVVRFQLCSGGSGKRPR